MNSDKKPNKQSLIHDVMPSFPSDEEIIKKAEEFIGGYNGCNDHYVKRGYMWKMAQWIKSEMSVINEA